jgi:Multicopper oxidase
MSLRHVHSRARIGNRLVYRQATSLMRGTATTVMKLYRLLVALPLVGAALHTHDSSFQPDYVLRVTAKNASIGGVSRYSTCFNGSIPGPPLRLPENKVVWIRVYNDMTNQNLTTVSVRPDPGRHLS